MTPLPLARGRPRRTSKPRPAASALLSRAVQMGSAGAVVVGAHCVLNLALSRRLRPQHGATLPDEVSVIVPARDEAGRIGLLLDDLRAQHGLASWEVIVVDDQSRDTTAEVAARVAEHDPRVRLVNGAALPAGWTGKTWACHQGAAIAHGQVLVFIDADVRLDRHAVAATVELLRRAGLDLVSPFPRQVAVRPLERMVQPLLAWSWMSTLPIRVSERATRPSLVAAGGQLLAVDADAYRRSGGHQAVASEVLDDVALARRMHADGARGGFVDGSRVATCRMYDSDDDLVEGWSKSLWSATSNPAAALAVVLAGLVTYVLPPAAAALGSRTGAVGYAAAVLNRAAVARVTGEIAHDAWSHPFAVLVWSGLVARSWRRRARNRLTWKGRVLP